MFKRFGSLSLLLAGMLVPGLIMGFAGPAQAQKAPTMDDIIDAIVGSVDPSEDQFETVQLLSIIAKQLESLLEMQKNRPSQAPDKTTTTNSWLKPENPWLKLDTNSDQKTGLPEKKEDKKPNLSFSNISHWSISNRTTGDDVGYQMKGEVTNDGTKDFSSLTLSVTVYGSDGEVLGSGSAHLWGLRSGQTKPFETTTVYGVTPGDIYDYKIEYDRGY